MATFNRNMTLRIISRWSGKKLMAGTSVENSGGDTPLAGSDVVMQGADASRAGQDYDIHSDLNAYADNSDVWRRRFSKHGISRLRRRLRKLKDLLSIFFAFLAEFRSAKLTSEEKRIMLFRMKRIPPEELEIIRQKKVENDLFLFHKQQAKLIEKRLLDVLTNLGFCYHITKGERKFIKKRISVAQADISPFAYTYHLTRMPFGVKVTEIAQDWVSTELSASIGKKIRYDLDLEGLRFTVEVGSTLSIPNFVGFGDLDDKRPMPKNLPPLAFWAGLAANGSPVYRNLADAPHLIIAGSSGGGKSNMENAIVCTLIRNNVPTRLRLVFFDLKGGVEFDQYDGIPHLFPMERGAWSTNGIVQYPNDVLPALDVLLDECMTRLQKLKKAGVKNISEYNRKKRTNTLPYIIIMFDEWASTVKLVGKESETKLSNIANLSRAAGMHFILSTQYPKAEILNTTISVNFPWRIAFNMPSGASQSVLGDWGAVGLTPTGRAVLLTNDGQIQIQTPRITNQNVIDVVEEAKTGHKNTRNMLNIDVNDVLEWSFNYASCKLDQESVFNQFREKIAREDLRNLLREMENKTYDVQGTLYTVLPGIGTLSRRMVLAEETGQTQAVTAYSLPPTEKIAEIEQNFRNCEHCGARTNHLVCEYCGKITGE